MTFPEKLKTSLIVLDGAMGTALLDGMPAGTRPETLNVSDPERVIGVHRAYLDAGSDVIYTNTFGANPLKSKHFAREIQEGVRCARAAVQGRENKFIALDVGPTGKLLKPLGALDFEDAVCAFRSQIEVGVKAGVDLIAIETMSDPYEMKAAIIACKECCTLPIIATLVFGADAKTMTGCSPEAAVALLEGLGVSALGVNCSLAPHEMREVVLRMLRVASVPVAVKPNAGLPEEKNGKAVYSVAPEEFAEEMRALTEEGVRVVGGCCGTTPEYIGELVERCVCPRETTAKNLTVASSYSRTVCFGGAPVLIGERLNPTGKKRLKQALREGDIAYVLGEAVAQAEQGAHALDVNAGLPELDETEVLSTCVKEIQAVTDLPLQLDTSDPVAMERAMRVYNGKPLVNSVNGKQESMQAVFPLVKKYGGVVICLTLDENGIPATAEGRVAVAEKIIRVAEEYGIGKNELIFDTLATAVSADPAAGCASLDALRTIRSRLGCNVSLGVSNISFGLPQRETVTASYLLLALGAGLSAAICNPCSEEIKRAYYSYLTLCGHDEGCAQYIAYASRVETVTSVRVDKKEERTERSLNYFIRKGLKKEAAAAACELLHSRSPLEVIREEVIPALDEVGEGFENKRIFLPQLLMSAEAAGAAFEVLRSASKDAAETKKTVFVLATVKGDIHDIGKNIVAMLLRNYGFTVHDLGKDVAPEAVVDAAKRYHARVVGLSALMTTTVTAMKETVALLKKECPDVKTCVGGAVLTADYAAQMGADRYCRDAMDTVRYAEELERGI